MKSVLLFILLILCTACNSLYLPPKKSSNINAFQPEKPVRIALVLGGGGSKGLAHLGAIQELEAAGIRPDLIIGCSAGSIVGAFYADNPLVHGMERLFLKLKRKDLLDPTLFQVRYGFVEGKALQDFLKKNLRAQTFKDLQIPLIVIATDLFTGETVELWEGDIPTAVNASSAFPGIFKPILLHNRYLIDGGAASPIPVEIAKKYGAEIIIAIDVSEKLPTSTPYHLLGIAKRSMEIAYQKFVDQSLEKADIAIKMNFQDVGMFSDHLNREMYETGRIKTRAMIPKIQKKLAECTQSTGT